MKVTDFEKGLYTGVFLCWVVTCIYFIYTCDMHYKESNGNFDYAICRNWIK